MLRRLSRQAGVTFVETLVSLGVLAVSLGGFAMVVISTQSAASDVREKDIMRAQAYKYMERLYALPFGVDADPAATTAQMAELFDDDGIVTAGLPITLKSLETPVDDEGWRFAITGFETDGVFEIEINSDLDGDGTFRGIRGTDTPTTGGLPVAGDGATIVTLESENDPQLMRVEIFWNGESLLRTYRAAPVEGT